MNRYDNSILMALVDLAEGKFFNKIRYIANGRLNDLALEFRSKFPKRSLKIVFGNRDELISIDGKRFVVYDDCSFTFEDYLIVPSLKCLEFIAQAVCDVCDITDGYRRGCPDDLEVLPDDSELGGKYEQDGDDRNTGKDIPNYGECPGYICPRPGLLGDAVHI